MSNHDAATPEPGQPLPPHVAHAVAQLVDFIAAALAATHAQPQDAGAASPPSTWLNIDSAAHYLDWPRQRLYKLTATGAIPHYKHDRRLLFRRDELDRWLSHHRQPIRPGT